MDVYWLEQSAADVPAENDWLSASEMLFLNGLRFAKRRDDWRLGRWTAKRALASFLDIPAQPRTLAKIEIRPALSGAPEVFVANSPADLTISLSHRAGVAACAVARTEIDLGCDLEMIEPRSDAFLADYFTDEEQAMVRQSPVADRSRLLALLWSAKESALKALREGLRLDTRSVAVTLEHETCDVNGWRLLNVRHAEGRLFHGWWQCADGTVRTLVADPPPNAPIHLTIAALSQPDCRLCLEDW